MPLFGALTLPTVVAHLPAVRDLDTEAWPLPGTEILQLAFEVPRDTESLLPRAMHPAIRIRPVKHPRPACRPAGRCLGRPPE